ncbi:MAG: tRNA pseudouridine(55) synthase TruB [Xanthomonadales bacterium]|jgi:tRNA pseudouridine55 synthase|nr:tRNA pseudouridine(55) synthase TruB [Xanthomonadales bacterium]
MSRRSKGRDVHGIVLLDKPAGYTSSQAVQKVRWLFQARKAGHTGTLDPFATGMLPICLGEASKTAGFMLESAKTYVARALLGQATTTGDTEGEVSITAAVPALDRDQVTRVLAGFQGQVAQIPPMYSALKHQGKPLYRLARAGQEVPREARQVTIHALELLTWEAPVLEFRVRCSKGTYVRTLAEDIAQAMGSCAHLQALRRLEVEPFQAEDMFMLEELADRAERGRIEQCLLPPDAGLRDWPIVRLDAEHAVRFGHGNPVEGDADLAGMVRVYGPGDILLGLGEMTAHGILKARRVMHLESPETA